jgi:2-amino-4-hydroxy-6-hydroxymethyldihydropteridine diphosphokinase
MRSRTTENRCYVGLGSNLDNPTRQIETALHQLHVLPSIRCVNVSSLYHSLPMGPADQPNYINAVAELMTGIPATELLGELLKIETAHGRHRATGKDRKNGPRTLDLDLLLYADQQLNLPGLCLPHPGLHLRDFVVLPLLEIAPAVIIPGLGQLADLPPPEINRGAARGDPPQWH